MAACPFLGFLLGVMLWSKDEGLEKELLLPIV
jgi:hypothetical protein